MITIKCGNCYKEIMNRAKSIYSPEVDEFYCDLRCEKKHLEYLDSKLPEVVLDSTGQYYWHFPM